MSNLVAYRHFQRALARWPVDVLRPDVSFQKKIQSRIEGHYFPSRQRPEDKVVANDAQATIPLSTKLDENSELDQVNVLYSFLENRYTQKYPLSDKSMKPASNPAYYDELIRELQEAPRRSWFGSALNKWKGFLRFS